MSDGDPRTWQSVGEMIASAAAGLGLGRFSKREQTEKIVEAIEKMEHTLSGKLSEVNNGISRLLGRDEGRHG